MKLSSLRVGALLTTLMIASACDHARYEQTNGVGTEGSNGSGPSQPKPEEPPAGRVSQVFTQDPGGNRVDILVISDDSFSMDKDQKKLASKFNTFVDSLGDLDWQVGVTTTDVSSSNTALRGELAEFQPGQYVLTPETPNAQALFQSTVVRKCEFAKCGSSNEQPLQAAILSMQKAKSENYGFFRDKVDLALIVISDEDEMSTGKNSKATRPQKVVDTFKSLWGDTKKLAAYGIVVKPNDKACLQAQIDEGYDEGTAYYGTFMTELARLSGGATHSICESDYGPLVSQIAEKIRKLVRSFELDRTPAAGSVEVKLVPSDKIDYRVEGKRVVFERAPQPGTRIEISYVPN